jgi:REP element-mobilizing transposase RayT
MPVFDQSATLLTRLSVHDPPGAMASTYSKLHYHIVFSTHHRQPWIAEDWEPRLHAFLNGCLQNAACQPIEIGGYRDHVHILTGLKPTHKVCDVVCDIKSASSRWVHQSVGLREFNWQEGYGALTTSVREDRALKHYIRNQRNHHRMKPFLEEYRSMLDEAGIEWDERYLR